MQNNLIEMLMPKSSMLVKEAGSSITAALPEDSNTTSLDFTKMFNVSMNEGLKTVMDCIILSDPAQKSATDTTQTGGNDPVEDPPDEERCEIRSTVCLDTQSLIALFQAYFSAQDKQSAVKQPADDTGAGEFQNTCPKVQVDEFLQNVLHLLEQGDSVRITLKQIPIPIQEQKQNETVTTVSYDNELKDTELEQAETRKDEIEVSECHTCDFDPLQKMDAPENNPIFYRMAAVLEQMGQNIDKVTNESDGAGTQPIQYKISYEYSGDRPQVESSGQDEQPERQMSIETQQPFVNTDKVDNTKEDDTKPLHQTKAIIEIIKPMRKSEPASVTDEQTMPPNGATAGKTVEVASKVEDIVNRTRDEQAGTIENADPTGERDRSDENQMFSGTDFSKTNSRVESEHKVVDKSSFASMLTEKIEKISEQFAAKNTSLDMVVRLRIDEKESLIVGFKDQGQKVSVEIRTTSQNMGSFLQNQKEEIARQLENKNIHANIYVDIQNQNRDRKEQRSTAKKRSAEPEQGFSGALSEVA